MVIDVSQLNTYYIILLPLIVSFVAGIIRQDRLPQLVNEGISYAVALILSLGQALFGAKLGGSILADFGIVSAYTLAMLHGPLFQKLQQAVQTKVLSAGPAPTASDPLYQELQTALASLLSSHLQDINGLLQQFLNGLQGTLSAQQPSAPQVQQQPVPPMPVQQFQQPSPFLVRAPQPDGTFPMPAVRQP